MKCKRCDREYTPEEDDLGICCICFRDAVYERVFGEDWRQVVKANFEKVIAADALVEKANGAILAMSAAQTYIEENRGGLSNDTTRRLQIAIDVLDAALRKYREVRK